MSIGDDTTTLTNNIQNIIKYIGTTFVSTGHKTDYTGTITADTFVNAITSGYSVFKTKYSSSLPTATDITGPVTQPITNQHILYKTLTVTEYSTLDSANKLSGFNPATMEINYSKLLTANSDLLKELNRIRNAYSFLTESNLKLYKSRSGTTDIPISNYDVISNNNRLVSTTTVTISAINNANAAAYTPAGNIWAVLGDMKKFDFTTNDVFMIRRMLLLYELLVNIYISMWLYEQNADTTEDAGYLTNISNTANILINLNKNFAPDSTQGDNASESILKDLNINIQDYKRYTQSINNVNDKVKDLKAAISINKNTYQIVSSKQKGASRYAWTLFTVYSIAVLAILVVAILNIEKPIKLMILAIIFVIMIISAVIIYNMLYKRIESFIGDDKKETFANFYLIDPTQFVTGSSSINKADLLTFYGNSFLSQANDYLNTTLYLGVILQSGRVYGGMNNTIKREINYYKKVQNMLGNTNKRIKNSEAILGINIIISSARVEFFIYLGIVLALTIIAYVIVGDNAVYQPYIFAIAGLFILLAIFKYLYAINKHVRRDPAKLYWNRPSYIDKLD